MTVQLFNTFDVKDQDFHDIACEGCGKNGGNFDFLLLCADCGSFMCDPCMFQHMKNFDENHNSLPTVKETPICSKIKQEGPHTDETNTDR